MDILIGLIELVLLYLFLLGSVFLAPALFFGTLGLWAFIEDYVADRRSRQ